LISKINAEITINYSVIGLTVETPEGVHTLQGALQATKRMPADYILSLEASSPFLENGKTYKFTGSLMGKREVRAQFVRGDDVYALSGKALMRRLQGKFEVELASPIFNFSHETTYTFENAISIDVKTKYEEDDHTFALLYDRESHRFLSTVVSKYVPTNMIQAEAKLDGSFEGEMDIKFVLKNAIQAIGVDVSLNRSTANDITAAVSVSTPFENYKSMSFAARYLKADSTVISFSADHPLNFKGELTFGSNETAYKANMLLETDIEEFKTVKANVNIPFNEFAPSVMVSLPSNEYGFAVEYGSEAHSSNMSTMLTLGGAQSQYSAFYSLRTKAPFDVAFGWTQPGAYRPKPSQYHLRTDSSFLTMLY